MTTKTCFSGWKVCLDWITTESYNKLLLIHYMLCFENVAQYPCWRENFADKTQNPLVRLNGGPNCGALWNWKKMTLNTKYTQTIFWHLVKCLISRFKDKRSFIFSCKKCWLKNEESMHSAVTWTDKLILWKKSNMYFTDMIIFFSCLHRR